jgi:fucose permease
MVRHDLSVVKIPYLTIAGVVLFVLILFAVSLMPDTGKEEEKIRLGALFRHLLFNFHYVGGVIALEDQTPNDGKLGSAGLIFAIVGSAFMPRLQGMIIDGPDLNLGPLFLESIRLSFFLPVLSFILIAAYGLLSRVVERRTR